MKTMLSKALSPAGRLSWLLAALSLCVGCHKTSAPSNKTPSPELLRRQSRQLARWLTGVGQDGKITIRKQHVSDGTVVLEGIRASRPSGTPGKRAATLSIERLAYTILSGAKEPTPTAYRLEVKFLGGTLKLEARRHQGSTKYKFSFERLSLGALAAASGALAVPLNMRFSGKGALQIPDAGIRQAQGQLTFQCNPCRFGGGRVGMGPGRGAARPSLSVTLPTLRADGLGGRIEIHHGELRFLGVKVRSADAEVTLGGHVSLRSPVGRSRLSARLGFRFTAALKQREPKWLAIEAALRRMQDARGYFRFAISGRLGRPRFTPRRSPSAVRASSRPVLPARPSQSPAASLAAWRRQVATGVKKLGDRRYHISKALLQQIMAHTTNIGRDADLRPASRHGKAYGFKLAKVAEGGIFQRLGLRSGDILVTMNGIPMTSPDKVLELYTKAYSITTLPVVIERGGKRLTFTYKIGP